MDLILMSKIISEHGLHLLGSIYSTTPIAAAPHPREFCRVLYKSTSINFCSQVLKAEFLCHLKPPLD